VTAERAPAADEEGARAAASLARRIAAGDREAEGELVARYGRGVNYLLRHLTRDPEWADDLYQETFAVVLERLRAGGLRDPEKLPAFLRGTARNLVLAGRRKRRRPPASGPPGAAPDAEAPESEPPDPAPGPLRTLLLEEEMDLTRKVLAQLGSPRDREVLFRFCVAEEDRERIRADLGLTRQGFNLVLFRARRRFRALFEAALDRPGQGEAER
jgi:RNA polymerase sigma-70 factor (ECF subfamily)